MVRNNLTVGELRFFDLIREGRYDSVTSKQVSQLVNSTFNVGLDDDMKKGVIKAAILWGKQKNPNETKESLNRDIVKRIKQKPGYTTTTRDLRNNERNLYMNIRNDIQFDDEEEKHDDGPDAPITPVRSPAPPIDPATAAAAAVAAINASEQPEEAPVTPPSTQSLLSQYIDTGSDFYKKNQKKINQALKALQPKNFEDGSWLTKLVSLEFPAVGLLQEVMKVVPGGSFSSSDNADWAKMLSNDPDVNAGVDPKRAMELMFKSLVNPDSIGLLISKTAANAAEDVEDWWLKLTGQPRNFDEDQASTAQKIEDRRTQIAKDKAKESDLDDWFKKATKDADTPDVPAPMPVKPDEWDELTAYQILFPPVSELGMSWEDFRDVGYALEANPFIRKPGSVESKDQYIEYLRTVAPEIAMSYATTLEKHDRRIAKAGSDRDSPVNPTASAVQLSQAEDMTKELIQQSIDAGSMDREAAGKLYEAWSLFGDVRKGEVQISYKDLEDLQKQLFGAIPKDILAQNKEGIDLFMQANEDFIKNTWEGDSDLGDYDWLREMLSGEGADGDDPDKKPQEKIIRPKMQEPKYRYRGKWGNTDEEFKRSENSIAERNLILEVQRLREDLDTTNKLIQGQLMTDRMRYNQTFKMPEPEPYVNKSLSTAFKKDHRAIFQPQLINPLRDPYRNMRQEDLYGQYQLWSPNVPETTERAKLMQDPLIYPSNADIATGGEAKQVAVSEIRFGRP